MALDSLILIGQMLLGSASIFCLYEKDAAYLGIALITITLAIGLFRTKRDHA